MNVRLLLTFFCGIALFSSCGEDNSIDVNITDKQQLVETYADRYEAVMPYPVATAALEDFDDEDAYDFQEDFVEELEKRGETVIGFKLGFTGDAPRPFGAPTPVYGRLLASQQKPNNTTLDISETFAGGNAGVELALFISKDAAYDEADFPLAKSELMSLIGSIAPLAEFPEIAFEEMDMVNYKDLIASNAGARAHIVGDKMPLNTLSTDIDSIQIQVFKNDEQISTGISGDALGSQLEALEFLLRSLAERNEGVKAGQIIATGSLGSDLPLETGTYRLVYEGLGEVNYTLVE